MVFENHTAGDRVEGDEVGPHIAGIFERSPDLHFTGRRLYARDGLVVSEWTATATNGAGRRVEWDGIDVFPFEDGLILRKDVYSSSHNPRVLDQLAVSRPRVHEAAGVPAEIEQELAASFELVDAPGRRRRSRHDARDCRRRGVPRRGGTAAAHRRQLRRRPRQHRPRGDARTRDRRRPNTPGVLTNATAEHAIALDARAPAPRRAKATARSGGATSGSGGRTSWSERASRARSSSSSGPGGSAAASPSSPARTALATSFAGRDDDLHAASRRRGRRHACTARSRPRRDTSSTPTRSRR